MAGLSGEWTILLTIGSIGIVALIGIALLLKYAGIGEMLNIILNALSNIVQLVTRVIQWAPKPLMIAIFLMVGLLLLPLITTLVLTPTFVCAGQYAGPSVSDSYKPVLYESSYVGGIFAKFQDGTRRTDDVQARAVQQLTGGNYVKPSLLSRMMKFVGMGNIDPYSTPYEGTVIFWKDEYLKTNVLSSSNSIVRDEGVPDIPENEPIYLFPAEETSVTHFLGLRGKARPPAIFVTDDGHHKCSLAYESISTTGSVWWRYDDIDNPGYMSIANEKVLELDAYQRAWWSDHLYRCARPLEGVGADSAASSTTNPCGRAKPDLTACLAKIKEQGNAACSGTNVVLLVEPKSKTGDDPPSFGCVENAHYMTYMAAADTGQTAFGSEREYFIYRANKKAREQASMGGVALNESDLPYLARTSATNGIYGDVLTYSCDEKTMEVEAGLFGIPLFTRGAFMVLIGITVLAGLAKMLKLF